MQTHARAKLEILVEAPIVRRISDLLTGQGVRNITILPVVAGTDASGDWAEIGVTDAFERRLLVCVCAEAVADTVMERLADVFARYPGAVYRSQVQVMRSERF